jgi:undecaprenyl-diphosphatase
MPTPEPIRSAPVARASLAAQLVLAAQRGQMTLVQAAAGKTAARGQPECPANRKHVAWLAGRADLSAHRMDYWQALVLGLVEGLTEYLPVSSTGHLLVAQRLMGIAPTEAANAYAIAIQAGAIVAVLGLYRQRVGRIVLGLTGRDQEGLRLGGTLLVAFVPAAVLGLAFGDAIETYLFGPWPIVAAWILGGIALLVLGRRLAITDGASIEALTFRAALIIGIAQCAALWPGVSRSLATILGAVLSGLSLAAAVEFSFLLGLITLGAATAYKALESGRVMLDTYGPVPILIGFAAAWLSAVLAVRWMVSWLSRRGLGLFAWWRFAAAALVATLMLLGKM